MSKYRIYSLVDITKTGITENTKSNKLQRNQQRNWETVIQLITMRTHLLSSTYFGIKKANLKNYAFGTEYTGIHSIWSFEIVLANDPYFLNNDKFGQLKQDARITPIVLDLTETAPMDLAFLQVDGTKKNIYFKSCK